MCILLVQTTYTLYSRKIIYAISYIVNHDNMIRIYNASNNECHVVQTKHKMYLLMHIQLMQIKYKLYLIK